MGADRAATLERIDVAAELPVQSANHVWGVRGAVRDLDAADPARHQRLHGPRRGILGRPTQHRNVLGMGTLTEPAQAEEAREAGARFLVSPICDDVLAAAILGTGLAVMIGAFTPTEVYRAHRLGTDMVKIFPATAVGPDYIRALRGPFPQLAFVATGGVSAANVADWFASGVAAVGAGGELCPGTAMAAGRFDEITQRAREFVAAVDKARARSS